MYQNELPKPDAIALAHSQALHQHIVTKIEQTKDKWISFQEFMQMALYEPGLGYYAAGSQKFGQMGDFITAPEISPLFGHVFARAIRESLAQLVNPQQKCILELGAGTGKLAYDVLSQLELTDITAYWILEVSPDLRERQREFLQEKLETAWLEKIKWLDKLPEGFEGVVLANEVLDAIPVALVEWHETGIFERGVTVVDQQFVYQAKPMEQVGSAELIQYAQTLKQTTALKENMPYISEVNLAGRHLVRSLAAMMTQGVVFFVDYGFPESEYYHPDRQQGTLMCHYRHFAHHDPFLYLGLQDITAHVNFSLMAQTAYEAGLSPLGYQSQAQFLIAGGITELLQQVHMHLNEEKNAEYLYFQVVSGVQKLLSPSEMGEFFKVLILGKNLQEDFTLSALNSKNQLHKL